MYSNSVPPLIPGDTQNSSGLFNGSVKLNSTTIDQTQLGFFGNLVEQQTVEDYSVHEIVKVLVKYGLLDNYYQQEFKLVGSGYSGTAINQGNCVSLTSDGNMLAIGGSGDNANRGATWIFTRTGGIWSQQGLKLIGSGFSGNSGQGFSVSLDDDGTTLAVGAYDDNVKGAVWIFTRTGTSWTQQGSKLTVNTSQDLGYCVRLSSDGNTLAAGDISYSNDVDAMGRTSIFTRTNGVWSIQDNLIGVGYSGASIQGAGISLSSDGNTIAIGGSDDNDGIGAVWVFTRTGGIWSQQGSKLVGSGMSGNSLFGYALCLNSDGNTLAVGGQNDNSNKGATWIFTRTGGIWSQQGSKLVRTKALGNAKQGSSVYLSGDGTQLISSGPDDNGGIGATWIYKLIDGAWTFSSKLVGLGNSGASNQGFDTFSACLSKDKSTIAVGGPSDDTNIGAVWTFTNS